MRTCSLRIVLVFAYGMVLTGRRRVHSKVIVLEQEHT